MADILKQPTHIPRPGIDFFGEAGVALFGKLRHPFQEEQRLFIDKLVSIQQRSSSVTGQKTWAKVSVAHLPCHMLSSCFN